ALATLDRQVPDRLAHPERWMARERARLEILGMEGRWQAVVDRAARLPGGLPLDFVIWVRSREAHALLALERPTEARALLRDLIWFSGDAVPASWHDAWRRMLAEAYRMEGLPADALSTLRRLRQDRGAEADIPLPLEARILMDQDRHDEAAGLLEGTELPEGMALRWLALLHSEQASPEQVRQSMNEAALGDDVSDGDRARYLAVAAEAALRMADPVVRADTLEAAFGLQHLVREENSGFGLPADALWEAWLVLGEAAGNERQLLMGDDEAWLAAAAEVEPEAAVTGRALLAVVALRSRDEEVRAHAHHLLAEHVLTLQHGDRVLEMLYLDGRRFGAAEQVPVTVRNLLAEQAMGRGELDTASALMAGVALPPEGADPFDWGLRRARLLILGGQEEAGIDGLYDVLAGVRSLESDAADRFLQVLFDLQTVRRHDAAIHLFRAMAPRLEDPRQVREVLYWEADSHRALGEYEQAARLYLRSAAMGNGLSDPWGMTARFQAAQALADAGLVADARTLYTELLRITRDPERRVVLRQRLQELELR
ncbi:hypothetical protein B1C78_17280, partial [Thioalkalivibrio denitrificans]